MRRVLGPSHTYYYIAAPAPPVNIAGEYRIGFTAAGTCTALPDELQTRAYTATITPGSFASFPAGTAFDLALSGAEIFENPSIGVAGHAVGFKLFNDGYAYIVEQVATDVYVAITGFARLPDGQADPFEISVPFEGWIEYLDAHPRSCRRPRAFRSDHGSGAALKIPITALPSRVHAGRLVAGARDVLFVRSRIRVRGAIPCRCRRRARARDC